MEKTSCVILAAGDFPSSPEALQVLNNATFLCCCDGAAQEAIERGFMPHAIVGDGDSLSIDFKEEYKDIIHQISEQEYNDLTKATRYCISKGFTEITYLGCSGKREDHTLGNIALMSFYLHEFHIHPTMVSDHGTFTPCKGTHTFTSFPRQQVSIFNLSCTQLSSQGLKWQAYPYKQLWQGTLNESLATSFSISSNGEYIIYQTHSPKL